MTPALRCRADAEFDALRRDPMADTVPAGVATSNRSTGEIGPGLC